MLSSLHSLTLTLVGRRLNLSRDAAQEGRGAKATLRRDATPMSRPEILPFRGPPAPLAKVPLLDVGRGNNPLREEFLAAIAAVVDSGRFLHGPEVAPWNRTLHNCAERSMRSAALREAMRCCWH